MMYRLYKTDLSQSEPNAATTVNSEPQISFLFAVQNSDYQNFKAQINADEAQLEDADGDLMTAEQAKEYVATLP
jgi:hypothetical protein